MNKQNARTIVSFDWAIKTLLRDKADAGALEGFLSALLSIFSKNHLVSVAIPDSISLIKNATNAISFTRIFCR